MPGYRDWLIQLAPTWLRGPLGGGWLYSHGLLLDAQVEAAQQAVLARFITSTPNDGLPYIADERMLPRPVGASFDDWRAALRGAWDTWARVGTRQGMVAAFAAAGMTATTYSDRDWPNGHGRWTDYRVVLTGTPWTPLGVWGGGRRWGDGATWGSTATEADVASVFRIIRLWQPAEAFCQGVVIVFSGDPVNDPAHASFITWHPPI